jgi:phosphoribosylanthranilate isomerase
MVEMKFCGMTRPEDVLEAGVLGARYVGVIFADSPRQLTVDRARDVLDAAPASTARVGVFGPAAPPDVAAAAQQAGLDVVQLHGDPDAAMIRAVRRQWHGLVWAVLRVTGVQLPAAVSELFDVADAVVLDTRVDGKLGGTGAVLSWDALREPLARLRTGRARLVLAGGLHAGNVARAIAAIEPDVVDVSSGVESSAGIKDHVKMRAFRDAACAGALR